jgi:bifunctional DNA-binding transcriptional regulator/antitoxin component of YhaV-PrlF toxin-antitoxin module
MVKTLVSSKGQTTIPADLRLKWGARAVLWTPQPDGSAIVRPAPDLLSLFWAASGKLPFEPKEKSKARTAMSRGK